MTAVEHFWRHFQDNFIEEEALIISNKDPISRDKKMYNQFVLKLIFLNCTIFKYKNLDYCNY